MHPTFRYIIMVGLCGGGGGLYHSVVIEGHMTVAFAEFPFHVPLRKIYIVPTHNTCRPLWLRSHPRLPSYGNGRGGSVYCSIQRDLQDRFRTYDSIQCRSNCCEITRVERDHAGGGGYLCRFGDEPSLQNSPNSHLSFTWDQSNGVVGQSRPFLHYDVIHI